MQREITPYRWTIPTMMIAGSGLVDEAELIVVNAHRADRAFPEVENFVTDGRPRSRH